MDSSTLRVAARFSRFAAKRPMKPEKLKELMLKLRKGAGTSLKLGILRPVFDALGGWSFDEMYYPHPEVDYYPDNRNSFAHNRRDVVEDEWRKAKSKEVARLPTSDTLGPSDRHAKVYMDVGEIQEGTNSFWFPFKVWQISLGVRVTAPNRVVFEAASSPDQLNNEYASLVRDSSRVKFTDWLKNDTPFYAQLNAFLGMDPIEHEKERKELERKRVLRDQGNATCPVCFGQFKLTAKTKHGRDKSMPGMVLHGYKRPGTGYIDGNCYGQDWPPFELSSEGTEAYLTALKPHELRTQDYLEKLTSGQVTTLGNRHDVRKPYVKDEMIPLEWNRRLQNQVEETKGRLRMIQSDIQRLEKAVSEWKPEPLN